MAICGSYNMGVQGDQGKGINTDFRTQAVMPLVSFQLPEKRPPTLESGIIKENENLRLEVASVEIPASLLACHLMKGKPSVQLTPLSKATIFSGHNP